MITPQEARRLSAAPFDEKQVEAMEKRLDKAIRVAAGDNGSVSVILSFTSEEAPIAQHVLKDSGFKVHRYDTTGTTINISWRLE